MVPAYIFKETGFKSTYNLIQALLTLKASLKMVPKVKLSVFSKFCFHFSSYPQVAQHERKAFKTGMWQNKLNIMPYLWKAQIPSPFPFQLQFLAQSHV